MDSSRTRCGTGNTPFRGDMKFVKAFVTRNRVDDLVMR